MQEWQAGSCIGMLQQNLQFQHNPLTECSYVSDILTVILQPASALPVAFPIRASYVCSLPSCPQGTYTD